MEYKYEYKDATEREDIFDKNKELFWIGEQNIIDGNFLIFTDVQPPQINEQDQIIQDRINNITQYAALDNNSIDVLESAIISYAENNIMNGVG